MSCKLGHLSKVYIGQRSLEVGQISKLTQIFSNIFKCMSLFYVGQMSCKLGHLSKAGQICRSSEVGQIAKLGQML